MKAATTIIPLIAIVLMQALAAGTAPSAPSVASSITLSLSAHCTQPSQSVVEFHILASGTGVADNLSVTPYANGLSFVQQSASVQSMDNGANVTLPFNVSSYAYPGSYVVGFMTQYVQQGITLYASFPCLLSFTEAPSSLVLPGTIVYSGKKVHASFDNLAPYAINATIFTITPPNIHVAGTPVHVLMTPYNESNMTFNTTVFLPGGVTNVTYGAALGVQYIANGTSHAVLGAFAIPASGQQPNVAIPLTDYALYAAIAAIVVLIAASLIIRTRRKSRDTVVHE